MKAVPGVNDVKVYDRTCDAVILYEADRSIIIRALAVFSFKDDSKAAELVPDHTSRALNREFEDKLFFCIARRIVNKLIVPMPLRKLMAIYRSVRYIRPGLSVSGRQEDRSTGTGCHGYRGISHKRRLSEQLLR